MQQSTGLQLIQVRLDYATVYSATLTPILQSCCMFPLHLLSCTYNLHVVGLSEEVKADRSISIEWQALPMLGKVSLAMHLTPDSSAPLLCLHAVVL